MLAAVKQRYRDISPVTLQVGGAMTSALYCGEVQGVSGAESFLVELYRCKRCQFTCGLKDTISSHLLLRHAPYLAGGGAEDREGAGLRRGASPYQLDLNGASKQSDEDDDFLLYNMLDGMSPPTCDISSEVTHTCEVSTLFEEEAAIFPLKGRGSPSSQDAMAQSAHLMTLGLCRISAAKPPPDPQPLPPPTDSSSLPLAPPPHGPRASPSCPLCPLALSSRRLLDVHVRCHRASGGFVCVRCGWTAASWEELEPHWMKHCRRRRGRRGEGHKQEEKKKKRRRRRRSAAVPNADDCHSDRRRSRLIGRGGGAETEQTDRCLQSVTDEKKKSRRKTTEEEKETGFCCSLCHRKFSSKLTLRRHLGTHGGEKPFTCPQCSYSSRLKASLLQHLRTHTGEKPYRCSECPYASIDRSSLLRHNRTHSQEKPYRCTRCDYSSIQKKSLDLHARRHHTGEAFPCQQCEYSSPDRQLLLRHVRRHHAPPQHAAL